MFDVADDANNGDVVVRLVACAFHQLPADGILRRAEESLGKGQVNDRNTRLSLGVGRGKFPARKKRLAQRGKVAGRDVTAASKFIRSSSEGLYPCTEKFDVVSSLESSGSVVAATETTPGMRRKASSASGDDLRACGPRHNRSLMGSRENVARWSPSQNLPTDGEGCRACAQTGPRRRAAGR